MLMRGEVVFETNALGSRARDAQDERTVRMRDVALRTSALPSRRSVSASGRTGSTDAVGYKNAYDGISTNVKSVVKGKDDVASLGLVAIVCEGPIRFEDVPAAGRPVLARELAQSIEASSNRMQYTPDPLPGNVTGSSIFELESLRRHDEDNHTKRAETVLGLRPQFRPGDITAGQKGALPQEAG